MFSNSKLAFSIMAPARTVSCELYIKLGATALEIVKLLWGTGQPGILEHFLEMRCSIGKAEENW